MEPFKNEFSHDKAMMLAKCIRRAYPEFPMRRFSRGLETALEPLELKQRMHLLADRLESCLPGDPPHMFDILVASLADDTSDKSGARGFPVWPMTEIVARRGLGHFDESMRALAEMTKRFTAEFAIRTFLRADPERTFRQLHEWCGHPDEHVRRLVSEGSRPLLPWGGNLTELFQPPRPTLKLLDRLHGDASAYVRLSVSNHLNDFSKHDPSLVIATLTRWRKKRPDDPHFSKLARHACRTLLKAGHRGALDFHGYGSGDSLVLESCSLDRECVRIGESLGYRIVLRNTSRKKQRVMFDYAIHHRKANGSLSPKVFKGRGRELAPGETWQITGSHPFKVVTTRTYHSGIHGFEPLLNGRPFPVLRFELA